MISSSRAPICAVFDDADSIFTIFRRGPWPEARPWAAHRPASRPTRIHHGERHGWRGSSRRLPTSMCRWRTKLFNRCCVSLRALKIAKFW